MHQAQPHTLWPPCCSWGQTARAPTSWDGCPRAYPGMPGPRQADSQLSKSLREKEGKAGRTLALPMHQHEPHGSGPSSPTRLACLRSE